MIVVGVCVVRDEADIIDMTLRHHLATACDRVVVVDLGSTDGTPDVVQRLALDGRAVELRRRATPDGDDAAVTAALVTEVAREAHAEGAAWVVPFAAHELWTDRAGQALRPVLASTAAGDLQATVVPFVQDAGVRDGDPAALSLPRLSLGPDATPDLTPLAAWHGLTSVLRPSPEVTVEPGRTVTGAKGWSEHSTWVTCLSLPLRSRQALARRAGGADLDDAWARSSSQDGQLDVPGARSDVRWSAAAWQAMQGART